MLLEGWGPGCFSAAHMDKINLCVYDRLIYAPVAMGASLLVVKMPLSVIDNFFLSLSLPPSVFLLSLFTSISAILRSRPTAGTTLILDPGLLSAR